MEDSDILEMNKIKSDIKTIASAMLEQDRNGCINPALIDELKRMSE